MRVSEKIQCLALLIAFSVSVFAGPFVYLFVVALFGVGAATKRQHLMVTSVVAFAGLLIIGTISFALYYSVNWSAVSAIFFAVAAVLTLRAGFDIENAGALMIATLLVISAVSPLNLLSVFSLQFPHVAFFVALSFAFIFVVFRTPLAGLMFITMTGICALSVVNYCTVHSLHTYVVSVPESGSGLPVVVKLNGFANVVDTNLPYYESHFFPRPLEESLNRHAGDCKDRSVYFASMVIGAGGWENETWFVFAPMHVYVAGRIDGYYYLYYAVPGAGVYVFGDESELHRYIHYFGALVTVDATGRECVL